MKIAYSNNNNSEDTVLLEIKTALQNIQWGSLEIFIQDSKVVQITERNIKKMKSKEQEKKTSSKKEVR